MSDRPTVLITGAAGNLGSILARHLLPTGLDLRLMFHRRRIPAKVLGCEPVEAFNPYWDKRGRTFEDPDGYRVVLQNARWPA